MDPAGARAYIIGRLRSELPAKRTYHSLEHTLDVYASAIGIAEQEGVAGEDLCLLKMAALYHDAGFIVQDHDHEEASCGIARQMLPGFGFSPGQVERICALILATRLPQSPQDRLARILCDADLDYLGRADFWLIGGTLFDELRACGTLRTEREWNELQLRFLEQHAYFTPTNQRVREPVKQRHLAEVRAWLGRNP